MTAVFSARQKRGLTGVVIQRWLPIALNLVLIILIARSLAGFSWDLLSSWLDPSVNKSHTRNLPDSDGVHDIVSINWQMFGPLSIQSETKSARSAAPKTNLKLVLRGILSTQGEGGIALIHTPSKGEQIYRVGDKLPGSSTLHSVHSDGVLIERNGRLESLTLPKDRVKLANAGVVVNKGSDGINRLKPTEDAASVLRHIQKQFQINPGKIISKVNFEPATYRGRFQGFKINRGTSETFLDALDIKPGDVLVELNGTQISSPMKGMEALSALANARAVSYTVLRDGDRRSAHVSMDE
ncbi:MAG: hypothetical protein HQL54_08540 [Magnetococcales bacterium]|nr:hypothetical protein [Magnetococcales bacterium]